MVRAVEYVGSVVNRQARIIGVLNTFDRDGKFRLRPNPSQIFPGQRLGEDRSYSAGVR